MPVSCVQWQWWVGFSFQHLFLASRGHLEGMGREQEYKNRTAAKPGTLQSLNLWLKWGRSRSEASPVSRSAGDRGSGGRWGLRLQHCVHSESFPPLRRELSLVLPHHDE